LTWPPILWFFDAARGKKDSRATPLQARGATLTDQAFEDWAQERFNALNDLIADVTERMLGHGDDRVTILGMIQSAVLHGLHDGGFTDETR
jgi:hypothetical protein